MTQKIESAKLRELSVKASVDPRTILKLLAGEPVKGMSGHRAAAVLREAGFIVAEGR